MFETLGWIVPAAVAMVIVSQITWLVRAVGHGAWHHDHRAAKSMTAVLAATVSVTALSILAIERPEGILFALPVLILLGLIFWAVKLAATGLSSGAVKRGDYVQNDKRRPTIATIAAILALGLVGFLGLEEIQGSFAWLVPAVIGVAALLKSKILAKTVLFVTAALGLLLLL